MQRTTIIGLGQMGRRLAQLSLEHGSPTTVWNRSPQRAAALTAAGARVADTPAAAIGASDVVVICVHDYRATDEILAQSGVAAAVADKLIVQLTTGSPADARAAEAWAHERGAAYLDGAIQAAPEQMGAADTAILVSGAEAAWQRGEPLLRVFAGKPKWLGEPIGNAAAMDLATLSYVYGTFLGFLYGARFAESEGFRVDDYGRIIADIAPSFAAFLQHEGDVIARGDWTATQSPMSISIEATARIRDLARATGQPLELHELAASLFARAAAAGYAHEEAAALIKVLRA